MFYNNQSSDGLYDTSRVGIFQLYVSCLDRFLIVKQQDTRYLNLFIKIKHKRLVPRTSHDIGESSMVFKTSACYKTTTTEATVISRRRPIPAVSDMSRCAEFESVDSPLEPPLVVPPESKPELLVLAVEVSVAASSSDESVVGEDAALSSTSPASYAAAVSV
jgi:hypothetical protein